ncbi:endo-1,4-beta-xylanase [Geminisphaera colitermitum]|uniref:endo-1,4-beta-xylanase n=1 Tax=Geminisphaera colitermitum TaxID=1148786 RepID=UPI000158D298|nr:endo-1,4-beta-xylanase [Geminisphaera colitermitum]
MLLPCHSLRLQALAVAATAVAVLAGIVVTAAPTSGPVPGETLLDETDFPAFTVTGDTASCVTIEAISTSDPRILKITTTGVVSTFPKITATLRNTTPLARREIIHARFLMRTTDSARESGEGAAQFELEDSATFAISGQYSARAVGQWREFNIPLRLVRECPPGRAAINFRVGDRPQTIEIAGLRIIRPRPAVTDIASLPATPVQPGYEGSDPGASWRVAARERIERHRRSPLAITVVDATGAPVPGAQIHILQQRHAYRFGAAVRADFVAADTPRGARYRATISRHFNAVTFENDLKWERWLRNSATPLAAARWCRDNNIDLRGHTILWPTNTRLPDRFSDIANNPNALRAVIDAHITDIAGRTSPLVRVWDVVNEPFRNHDFMDLLGADSMAHWFRVARRAAPDARLYLNDYGIITGGGMDTTHQAYYERTVRELVTAKAPIDGLGFQAHFDRILTPPSRVLDILDRFSRLQREIELTEYSTQIEDPALAADYLRDMLTVFYSHPSTTGFILWSFVKNSGFRNTTWLQDSAGNLSSAGRVWHDLIYKQWWTDTRLVAAPDGTATIPAFHGRHAITVQAGSHETTVLADLAPGGAAVCITIPNTVVAASLRSGKNESR